MEPSKECEQSDPNFIKYDEKWVLLLFELEEHRVKLKMAGFQPKYARKMFMSKFKYEQLPEQIRERVGSLQAFFELLRDRQNFRVYQMAGIITFVFRDEEGQQEKVAVKLRKQPYWHEICDRHIQRPKEPLDPDLMKEEKFYTDSGRLYRITNFYGKRQKHGWNIEYGDRSFPERADFYWHNQPHGYGIWYRTGTGYPWEVTRVHNYC